MKIRKFSEKDNDVEIIANIKSNNIDDVEQFFNDVKKSYVNIVDDENEEKEENLNRTGRSYDEDNEEDEELLVQQQKTNNPVKIKKLYEFNNKK